MDWRLFSGINGRAGRLPALDHAAILAANYLPLVLVFLLVVVWLTGARLTERERRQRAVIYASVGAILAYAVTLITKHFIARARPFVDRQVNQLAPHANDSGFLADRSILAFAIVPSLFVASRRLGWIALVLAVAMGFARVFIGAHYPGDIVGGAVLGTATALLVWRLDPWLNFAVAPAPRLFRRLRDA